MHQSQPAASMKAIPSRRFDPDFTVAPFTTSILVELAGHGRGFAAEFPWRLPWNHSRSFPPLFAPSWQRGNSQAKFASARVSILKFNRITLNHFRARRLCIRSTKINGPTITLQYLALAQGGLCTRSWLNCL